MVPTGENRCVASARGGWRILRIRPGSGGAWRWRGFGRAGRGGGDGYAEIVGEALAAAAEGGDVEDGVGSTFGGALEGFFDGCCAIESFTHVEACQQTHCDFHHYPWGEREAEPPCFAQAGELSP